MSRQKVAKGEYKLHETAPMSKRLAKCNTTLLNNDGADRLNSYDHVKSLKATI